MSQLTQILKGIAKYQHSQSGLPKKALPIFEDRIKNLYYHSSDEKKEEMRKGFKETEEELSNG
jgi:hypothetical protein